MTTELGTGVIFRGLTPSRTAEELVPKTKIEMPSFNSDDKS